MFPHPFSILNFQYLIKNIHIDSSTYLGLKKRKIFAQKLATSDQ